MKKSRNYILILILVVAAFFSWSLYFFIHKEQNLEHKDNHVSIDEKLVSSKNIASESPRPSPSVETQEAQNNNYLVGFDKRMSGKKEIISLLFDNYNSIPKDQENKILRFRVATNIIDAAQTDDDFNEIKNKIDISDQTMLSMYIAKNISLNSGSGFGRIMALVDKSNNSNNISNGAEMIFQGNGISNETIDSMNKFLSENPQQLSELQQNFILNLLEKRHATDVVDLINAHSGKFTYYYARIGELNSRISASFQR